MKHIWNTVQAALAAVGGTVGLFIGGLDGFLFALIAFVVTDYILLGFFVPSRTNNSRAKSALEVLQESS